MKAILVGRHVGQLPDVEVVEQRAIVWPETAEGTLLTLEALIADAVKADAAIIFQNTPGQVAIALAKTFRSYSEDSWKLPLIGVVITKPGPRPTAARLVFATKDAPTFRAAIAFVNPNAKISDAQYDEPDIWGNVGYAPGVCPVSVEVDPPMRFEFSHIAWLNPVSHA